MSDTRRPALGRGLSALIPGAGSLHAEGASAGPAHTVPIDDVRAAAHQPRTSFDDAHLAELAASIEANGVLQPIVVRRGEPEGFLVIAGERRLRASRLAGLTRVPVVIREATDAEAFELALVENLQREDLDPLEEAEAYRHLVETYRMTQEQVARRVGKDRTTVANALRLLKLPPALQALVRAGRLTAGHARALLSVRDLVQQAQLAETAATDGWSVRQTEREARALRDAPDGPDGPETGDAPPDPPAPPVVRSSADEAVEARIRAALGAPIRLVQRQGKGRIEVRFHSLDELERLLQIFDSLEGN